jgi:nicotinate phosphoribosyltransferase
MDTSNDAPYLDCAYKLQEYAGRARRKRSEGKATWPGRKQVFRGFDKNREMSGDVLTLESDVREGAALIVPVMRGGKRINPAEPLADARKRAASNLRALPEYLRRLESQPAYSVTVAPALRELAAEVDRHVQRGTSCAASQS